MLYELDNLLTRFKQSKENLNKPCCDNLFETLKTKIPSFEDAAPHFGFKEPEIVEFRSDCSSERQRRLQMLWKWKPKNGSDATYLAIVKVFLNMENKQLAETVLEFCCEKELPSIDSRVNPSKVKKYQNWGSMSKFEQEKIKNNLHVENQKIRMKYSFLVDNFLSSLQKRNIQVSRLKLFLASYGIPQATLLNASTLADVLLIIQMSYSSWFNIQLFDCIVEQFGSDDDIEKMRVYKESHLVPYLQRSIFEMPSKSFGAGNETTDCITLGLRLPDHFIPTGEDVVIIKHNLSQLLGIANGILLFIRYGEGSIILVFGLLYIAEFQRVIEKYFTPDITKRIYTFSGDLAQVLLPGIHQEGSIVHRNLEGFHGYTQSTSSSQSNVSSVTIMAGVSTQCNVKEEGSNVDKVQSKRQVHHKDLQFLYVKLRGLNSEWKQYGLALRVMYEKLEEIETNPGKPTVRDKMTEVLLLWRGKEMKGKKTWCVVRDAAKQLHNLALAEEIELSKDLTMEVPMSDCNSYLEEMLTLLKDVIADWEQMGYALGLEYGEMRQIDASQLNAATCMRKVIIEYINKGSEATIDGMIEACRKIKNNALAEDLEKDKELRERFGMDDVKKEVQQHLDMKEATDGHKFN